jgi:hypothetical protein
MNKTTQDDRAVVPATLTPEESARRLAGLAVHINETRMYMDTLTAFLHAHQILKHTPPVAYRWTEADGSEQFINYANSALIAAFNDEASRLLDELDPPTNTK